MPTTRVTVLYLDSFYGSLWRQCGRRSSSSESTAATWRQVEAGGEVATGRRMEVGPAGTTVVALAVATAGTKAAALAVAPAVAVVASQRKKPRPRGSQLQHLGTTLTTPKGQR